MQLLLQNYGRMMKDWGLGSKELLDLKNSADRAIYTPGSSVGIPISVLASFEAPGIPWDENEELLREKISSTVTALLTLIGLKNIDPLRSREHILLANIIEFNWKTGNSLDLSSLILQTQDPPLEKLGAFPLSNFFPKKDRGELAMLLNNFLASPSFQSWIEGQPLDIQQLLFTQEGKPRQSIFYLAHLSDTERMFFITLLYAAIETWMRKQSGTGNLRALVYFDEIHGYLPPVANPPSKPLMIRLVKTARAFGVGMVLSTQNPVDVDYKALSNAGTWMVGRLQTDQDKQRLLDGLESAAGGVRRSEYDKIISALGKRVFLYHNVHEKKPMIFHTRWAMNYLAGPLTLTQIPDLNRLAGAQYDKQSGKAQKKVQPATPAEGKPAEAGTFKPNLPGIKQYFLTDEGSPSGKRFQPWLLAVADVRYFSRTPQVDTSHTIAAMIENPSETGQKWEDHILHEFNKDQIASNSPHKPQFAPMPEFMQKSSWWSSQEKEFEHWVYETDTAAVRTNKSLGISAGPDVSESEFFKNCKRAAEKKAEEEARKLESKYATKKSTLENKVRSQELKVDKYKKEMASRGLDTALKVGETLLKLATKRRLTGVSTSATKVRMTSDASARVKEAETLLEGYQEDLEGLEGQMAEEKQQIVDKWLAEAENYSETKLTPTKQNIRITYFGIGWHAG